MAEELLVGQRHPSIQGRACYRLRWEMAFSTAPPSHPNEARYQWDYVLNMDQPNSSTRVPAPDNLTTVKDCLAPLPTHANVTSVCQTSRMGEAHSPMRAGTSTATSQPHPAWDLRHSTRIATWNVSTLHRTGHQVTLVHELARLNIVVAGLTETRLLQHGIRDVEDATLLHSGGDSHVHGVALVLREKAKKSLVSWTPISPRLLHARLKHRHGHLSIIVAYAPTEVATDADKDQFYNQLDSLMGSIRPHDNVVVLGDMNAVTGSSRACFETVVGPYGSGTSNDNTTRLLTFCASRNLAVLGSWFKRRRIHRMTWICNDGVTEKEIDHIMTRDRRLFTSCRVCRSAECASNTDHHMVVATMQLSLLHAPKTGAGARRKFDTDALLRSPEVATQFSVAVSNRFAALAELPDNVEEAWGVFSSTMRLSAEQVIGYKCPSRKPWLSEEASISSSRRRKHVFKAISHPVTASNEATTKLSSS